LNFLDRDFEINKRSIPYTKIIRIHLFLNEGEKTTKRKLKIILVDEEFAITYNDKDDANKDKSIEIFLKILKIKLELKEVKFYPLERKTGPQ
jgi:hypothetical protein